MNLCCQYFPSKDNSLIKVTAAKVEKTENSQEPLIIIVECEVLIPGRYIDDFSTSDYLNTCVDVNDNSDKIILAKKIRFDPNYKLRTDLWQQARNQVRTKSNNIPYLTINK